MNQMNSAIAQKYADRIYRFMKRMAGEKDAEDLTQEAILKILKRFPKNHPNEAAYVFSVANSVAIDYFRKRKNESTAVKERAVEESPEPNRELKEMILAAVADLPLEQKQVFLLRQEGGLSFNEIADITGAPLNTVLGRMHYAMKNLKKLMAVEPSNG